MSGAGRAQAKECLDAIEAGLVNLCHDVLLVLAGGLNHRAGLLLSRVATWT
jgi:hypothetical protein